MKTAITIAILSLTAFQAHAAQPSAAAVLSGVPLRVAAQPYAAPTPSAAAVDVKRSGIALSAAKQPYAAPTLGAAAASDVAKSGRPMQIATQTNPPSTWSRAGSDSDATRIQPGAMPATMTLSSSASEGREQVVAELAAAVGSGDLVANGEIGLRLNQLYPSQYAASPVLVSKTRQQVKAELADAIRTGDYVIGGDLSGTCKEIHPNMRRTM